MKAVMFKLSCRKRKKKKKENETGYSSSDLASELLLVSTLKVEFFCSLKLQAQGKHLSRSKDQSLAAFLSWTWGISDNGMGRCLAV